MTPFGKFMRNIRLEKNLLLKDVADKLEVTSAYLSALEHGKKGAPNGAFVSKIENVLKLNADQRNALRIAARDSNTAFLLSSKSTPMAFETANAFARKLPDLSEHQLKKILGIVREELEEEEEDE